MSSVYFPVPVVTLIRRIFNAFSTVTITQQLTKPRTGENSHSDKFWPSWTTADSEAGPKVKAAVEAVKKEVEKLPKDKPPPKKSPEPPRRLETIHKLMQNPTLYDPVRAPRYPIVLCHGLYGFDTRGPTSFPSMRMTYWATVLDILRTKVGAQVLVTSVPGTGSIASRAETMNRQLEKKALGRGVNFLAHSMGGLDCRYLIAHVKPESYTPLSLTTIGTPHRGSPFMDWCATNIGLGKLTGDEKGGELNEATKAAKEISAEAAHAAKSATDSMTSKAFSALSLATLPSSLTALIMSVLDSPAYANLTTSYLTESFNPTTPDNPNVKYFSVAGRMFDVNLWHPFWLPKMIVDAAEKKSNSAGPHEWGNDGLVSVQSAKWGEFLGTLEGCDHWEMRGARGLEFGVDLPAIPALGLGSSFYESQKEGNAAAWSWLTRAWRQEEATRRRETEPPTKDVPGSETAAEEQNNEEMRSSAEKLTAVFDWIVEQVPSPSISLPLLKSSSGSGNAKEEPVQCRKSDMATKEDLERFYVALARKLYDEGL